MIVQVMQLYLHAPVIQNLKEAVDYSFHLAVAELMASAFFNLL